MASHTMLTAATRTVSSAHEKHGMLHRLTHRNAEARAIENIRKCNEDMAITMANYLDKHFPKNEPFFATALINAPRIRHFAGENSATEQNNIAQILKQRGYDIITLNLEPMQQLFPDHARGSFILSKENPATGIDISLSVIDPAVFKHSRGRR